MKKLLLILVASVALAQTPPQAPVTRVVPIKNANPQEMYANLSKIVPNGVMALVGQQIVVSALPSVADMLEEAIKKLDVPPPDATAVPNVELTVFVLRGSEVEGRGEKIPADLDSTVRQLRTLFPYKNYGLMDTQLLRTRSGGSVSATASISGANVTYAVSPSVAPGKAPHSLRLARFRVTIFTSALVDGKTQMQGNGVDTDLDAQEGQKIVVGKTTFAGDAVIIVVSPKVIE